MFSYFLKFIFLILFFEDVFFFSLEATYFIASDLSVLGKEVVINSVKNMNNGFFDNPPLYSVIHVIKFVATFIRSGDLSPTIDKT